MIEPWPLIKRRVLNKNRIFELRGDACEKPGEQTIHEFYTLAADDWVNVIALTPEGRIPLVRQFRHGTREITLEIPGGLIDSGTAPEAAAAAELAEETGYQAGKLTYLGRVRPNPAILDNWCYTYLAEDLTPGETSLDDAEQIELVTADPAEIPRMVQTGQIDHALVLCAFTLWWGRGA